MKTEEVMINDEKVVVEIISHKDNEVEFKLNEKEYTYKFHGHQGLQDPRFILQKFVNDSIENLAGIKCKDTYFLNGKDAQVEVKKKMQSKKEAKGSLNSPMPGKILKVLVQNDQEVNKGDALLILEAMKMEHTIKATVDGCVKKVLFKEGEMVQGGVQLIELQANES